MKSIDTTLFCSNARENPTRFPPAVFTFTDVLELKVNLEKYIFYMHFSVHSKLWAAVTAKNTNVANNLESIETA